MNLQMRKNLRSSDIGKPNKREVSNNSLDFFISDILSLTSSFEYIAWNFVKRGCNSVAHATAHLQPFSLHERIWVEEGADIVYDLTTKDMCTICLLYTSPSPRD